MKRVKFKTPPAIAASKEVDEVKEVENAEIVKSPDGFGQLPIDILENEEEILVITPIAGLNLDQTDIIITNDVLTIKGERQTDLSDFKFKKKDYYVQECFWGKFSRSVILPTNADIERIEARQKDHILYVRIPKKSNIKMRIVRIKT